MEENCSIYTKRKGGSVGGKIGSSSDNNDNNSTFSPNTCPHFFPLLQSSFVIIDGVRSSRQYKQEFYHQLCNLQNCYQT